MLENPALYIVSFLLAGLIVFAFSFEKIRERWDKARIRTFIRQAGAEATHIERNTFWADMTGEQTGRHYSVTCKTQDGRIEEAICKTTASGVEWVRRPYDDRPERLDHH